MTEMLEAAHTNLQETDWNNVQALVEQIGYSPNLAERATNIAHMSVEDLMSQVTLLHSVLAPSVDANPTDFSMTVASTHEGPDLKTTVREFLVDPESRHSLFNHASELIRQLGGRVKEGEEQAFLDRASNIAALSIVLAHPFEDGNGRTARVLAELIRYGHDPSKGVTDDLKILGQNRQTNNGFRMMSFIPTDYSRRIKKSWDDYLTNIAAFNIPLSEKQDYRQREFNLLHSPYPKK